MAPRRISTVELADAVRHSVDKLYQCIGAGNCEEIEIKQEVTPGDTTRPGDSYHSFALTGHHRLVIEWVDGEERKAYLAKLAEIQWSA